MLAKVRELAAPAFAAQGGVEAWIVDDTGFQKKGSHSVGVARQYCGRLEMWRQRAGLGNSPRTILEELARIQSHDVVLPTAAHGEIRLRCVTQPDPAQAALLDRLGVVFPKRMRLPKNEPPILALSA